MHIMVLAQPVGSNLSWQNHIGFKMNGNNTGHGLNNVKRRASLINARIDVHSEGDGTVAELDVPLDNFNNS